MINHQRWQSARYGDLTKLDLRLARYHFAAVQASTSPTKKGTNWGRFFLGLGAVAGGAFGVIYAKEPFVPLSFPRYCGLNNICGRDEYEVPVDGLKQKQQIIGWSMIGLGATVMALSF